MPYVPEIPWLKETPHAQKFLVGVSGGADSVALLHLLLNAGLRKLVVCHLNHGLRGQTASLDAGFVAELCAAHGLACEIDTEDVAALAESSGKSFETAGREARHRFFAACAKRHRCPRVLLAHHADDRAETVLWNLLRGSYGAKGMREHQTITVEGRELELIRPLLGVRRWELRRYLHELDLPWREDASNAEPITARNRLRHEAIPQLSLISGRDVVPSLWRAADAGEDQDEILGWALDKAKVLDPQGRLHVPAMRELPPALQRAAIFRFLHSNGIGDLDRELLKQAAALLEPENKSTCVNLPGGRHLRRRGGRMVVE
ncbi:tRNA lysidine(34) synthetase TilS [Luteolibacter ambystomatis]|uniref:tRNA(Ile)-lysidine synthase n=1 Tax=Luteolibacter ambystomatis TaxID=2824561 RepID=A0A975G7X1_9BACT|nr:tRNA lysidine(34) synthetase TilS [Luteolibacter ambystomatis]QUE50989.1 tRNA lysidine(34) synthetase TilS [Luteolibacter ambystomatis]